MKNKTTFRDGIEYPIFIAIHHQYGVERRYDTGEEVGEDDRYLAGDHDFQNIIKIENHADLVNGRSYKGHGQFEVHYIANEILERCECSNCLHDL